MPFVDLGSTITMYALKKAIDRGKVKCRKDMTGSKSLRAYIEVLTGPNFLINERYASTLNVVFVCFMYGTGLPILYWFALIFCLTKYFCDKFLLIQMYRKPPMLDDALHNRTLRVFNWVVVIFALNSYWMLSNKQLFGNDVYAKHRMSDIEQTGHKVFELPTGHSLVLFVVAILVLVIVAFWQSILTLSVFVK